MIVLILIAVLVLLYHISRGDVSMLRDKELVLVSYDYDNTLKDQDTKKPIMPVVRQMQKDIASPHVAKVIVCTSRFDIHTDEIRDFLRKHGMNDVPIYATNREMKSVTLNRFASEGYQIVHYDDQDPILNDIVTRVNGSKGVKVRYLRYRSNPDLKLESIAQPF